MRRRDPNPVFGALGTTIFTVMSALAAKHGAINLGQGFPDEDGPLAIREVAAKALRDGPNQYPPMQGLVSFAGRSPPTRSASTISTSTPRARSSSLRARRKH